MNAKEQMQALIDGKVLMCDGNRYKLDDDGDIVQYSEYGAVRWSKVGGGEFVVYRKNYIVDESKCVDFAHAMGMIAGGKVMRCLWSEELYRIRDGALQMFYPEGWAAITKNALLDEGEMESLWMEVEE